MKKILFCVCLLTGVFGLLACRRAESTPIRYSLLYTEEFATLGKQTSLVHYDEAGNVVKKDFLHGALHYNLFPEKDGFSLDNGVENLRLGTERIHRKVFKETRGILPSGQYLYDNNQLIKFYKDTSLTRIEKNDTMLELAGYLHGFQQLEDGVLLLLQEELGVGSYFLWKLYLPEFQVEKLRELPLNTSHDVLPFSKSTSSDSFLILDILWEKNPEGSQQTLYQVPKEDPLQLESYTVAVNLYTDYDIGTYMDYQGRHYMFDQAINQLYEIKLNPESQVVYLEKTGLSLGGDGNVRAIQYRDGDHWYVLKTGASPVLYELDLKEMILVRKTELSNPHVSSDKVLSSFYVHP